MKKVIYYSKPRNCKLCIFKKVRLGEYPKRWVCRFDIRHCSSLESLYHSCPIKVLRSKQTSCVDCPIKDQSYDRCFYQNSMPGLDADDLFKNCPFPEEPNSVNFVVEG